MWGHLYRSRELRIAVVISAAIGSLMGLALASDNVWGWSVSFVLALVAIIVWNIPNAFVLFPSPVRLAIRRAFQAIDLGRDVEQAVQHCDKVLQEFPEDPWILSVRAACLISIGQLPRARHDMLELLDRMPEFAYAQLNLAIVELLSGRTQRAHELASSASRKWPQQYSTWLVRGMASLDSGDYKDADESFLRASRCQGGRAHGLLGRALVGVDLGKTDEEVGELLRSAREVSEKCYGQIVEARLCHRRGLATEARVHWTNALDRVRESGYKIWIPFYEELGRRWKII
jgi:predicted Zn-dependent protease